MTLPNLAARASANQLATYLALGREFPRVEVLEREGYVALLSDLPHPSGNFAARLRLDPWVAGELRELAASRPAFQTIALPDDGPEHLAELLSRAGFHRLTTLATMTAPAPGVLPAPGERVRGGAYPLVECADEPSRRRIARFMADVFFTRESEALRDTMAHAMARAQTLSLHALSVRDRPMAAVALVREGGALGIYNLCVAGPHRGKGHGAAVVEWCLAQAAEAGLPAVLQCATSLEPWYARHGFARAGSVSVWSL